MTTPKLFLILRKIDFSDGLSLVPVYKGIIWESFLSSYMLDACRIDELRIDWDISFH